MAHEKRLLVDVFQAYFYRKDAKGNRQLVFMSENLTSGSVSTSQDNTDVKNGQGNTLFAVLPGNKDVTVSLTENVFSFEALQVNSAGVKSAGAATGIAASKSYRAGTLKTEAGSGNAANKSVFELDKLPVNADEISIEIGGKVLANGNAKGKTAQNIDAHEFFVAADKNGTAYVPGTSNKAFVVLHQEDAKQLDKERLKVMPYVYKTDDAKTSTITVDAKQFSEGGELWLQTIEKDEKQKATAYVYFVFENAMPEGNFEISTVSEVQPNDMSVNMRILANENGELYRIVREEI